MDKYEYKIKSEEIRQLIAEGNYALAAELADGIDWRRVKSVMMLCTISDLYKINKRYEDARDMLLLAYDKRPGGRTICYSLCELCLKTGDYVQAVEYYKEFVQVAPKDPGKYILQYKIYETQDVGLEERIQVLEELKKADYREKWAYELAYLYHRVGLASKCVEECDELILWFGSGRYVIKAMELKMLHQPLSEEQQEAYDHRFDPQEIPAVVEEEPVAEAPKSRVVMPEVTDETKIFTPEDMAQVAKAVEKEPEDMEIHVKTMEVDEYSTINLQAEIAAGLKEILGEQKEENVVYPDRNAETISYVPVSENAGENEQTEVTDETKVLEVIPVQQVVEEPVVEESAAKEPVVEQPVAEQVIAEEPKKVSEEVAKVLTQGSDGQISLHIPEEPVVDRQITGQMNIEDILVEWERMKKENQERHEEQLRQQVLQQTGEMFTAFEASIRDGLLEKLEKGTMDASEIDAVSVAEEAETVDDAEDLVETGEVEELEEIQEVTEEEPELDISTEPVESDPETVEPEEVFEEADEEVIEEIASEPVEEAMPMEEASDAEQETVEEEVFEDETSFDDVEEALDEEESAEDEEEEIEEPDEESEESDEEPEEAEDDEKKAEDDLTDTAVDMEKLRELTQEEKELYGPYIYTKSAREQLVRALDSISMAPYTGNLVITGAEGVDILTLAKNIVNEVQQNDSNFSGKVAKISAQNLNRKDVSNILDQIKNGSLIIEHVSDMTDETAKNLYKGLQQENRGMILVILDTKKQARAFLKQHKDLASAFTAKIDIEPLSDDVLVMIAKKYAKSKEFSIDDFGMLALHKKIDDLQTSSHVVTANEVKGIVDDAIHHAKRKTLGHFADVLFGKRYDEEDMIILGEKDFA